MKFKTKTIIGIAIIEGILLTFLGVSLNNKLQETNSASVLKRVETTERLLFASLKDAVISNDLATIQDVVKDMIATGDLSYVNITDSNNNSLVKKGNTPLGKFSEDYSLIEITDGVFDKQFKIDVSGQHFGTVQFGFDVKEMLQIIEETKNWTLFVALLEIILVALFSYILGVYLTKQLMLLRDTSRLVAKGELDHNISVIGNDELSQTAIAFNEMISKLKNAKEEQILHQSELKDAAEKAEKANIAKSRFLATMSHELRTPLNGILGTAQLLKEQNVSDKEKEEYINILLDSGNHLLVQLNEILDFSKIESGKYELKQNEFSFDHFIKKLNIFKPMANNKNIDFFIEHNIDINKIYLGDYDKLWKIISNFVNNAIKFTDKGHVKVLIEELSNSDKNTQFKISVTDTGLGIPNDKINYIFQPFTQTDDSLNRKFEGTGLGLAIAKKLSEIMNAKIEVFSTINKGSTFELSFELKKTIQDKVQSTNQSETQKTETNLSSTNLLVVEDNPNNRKIIQLMLDKIGIKPTFKFDGLEALEHIKAGNKYDVIFMDLMMPNMDGITSTIEIRKFEKSNNLKPTPIIAVTASSYDDDKQKCFDAGMNTFISKPISITSLNDCLKQFI